VVVVREKKSLFVYLFFFNEKMEKSNGTVKYLTDQDAFEIRW